MKSITGLKDTDRLILLSLNDMDLLSACQVNKSTNSLCDDEFFKQRLYSRYPQLFPLKPNDINWRNYYLTSISYIDRLLRDFNFNYSKESTGTPEEYYRFLNELKDIGINEENLLLKEITRRRYIDLIYFLAKRGIADKFKGFAIQFEFDEIFDSLVKTYGDIPPNLGLIAAVNAHNRGKIDYYISKGASPQVGYNISKYVGNEEMKKYILSKYQVNV
jgi:hypothetical protein